jgi:tRNA (guanine37-N1)-methyltransferase
MKSRALRVERGRGEAVRRLLRDAALLRSDLEILRTKESLLIPILENGAVPREWGTVTEGEFDAIARPAVGDYRRLLHLPPEEQSLLPRSFDVVGDVVLVRIPDELASHRAEIGTALLGFVPGARIVGADRGVHGTERTRSLERIAGSGGWTTRHRENGIEVDVDLARAYFSPRLAREHARVAEEVGAGDRVYDLCCGVGPFSLTIARDARARSISAVDSNASAIALLRAAAERQRFPTPIRSFVAPVEDFSASAEPVERVILNLPHQGIKYLPSVARTVARRGRLYYYEVTPRAESDERGMGVIRILDAPNAWSLVDEHVVHPYSPQSDLRGYVLERTRAE